MHFCSGCQNEAVKDWVAGRAHNLPTFGDNAQRVTAIRLRRMNFISAITSDGHPGTSWPEWNMCLERLGITAMTPTEAVEKLPFPRYLMIPRRGMPGAQKRKRYKGIEHWERPFGAGYRHFLRTMTNVVYGIEYTYHGFSGFLPNLLLHEEPELQLA
jgi:hypothetical protein